MPTEKAHGAQIMKTCEAFARAGAEVNLIVPARKTSIKEDSFAYYGAESVFTITRVPVVDVIAFGRVGFIVESCSFAFFALLYVLFHAQDVVYSRDELPLWLLSFFVRKSVWESHTGSTNFFTARLLGKGKKCVVISRGLKEMYEKKGARALMHVSPDSIDLAEFEHAQPKEEARKRLALLDGKKIVMYIGRLDGWKGVSTLLEASSLLPEEFLTVVIGGEPAQVADLASKYPRVMFLGARPYRELADNQAAADILVLPNTAKDIVSARYTSPKKIISYMASGKPIVASDLPSLREVLSEKNAYFFAPDDPRALAQALKEASEDERAPRRGQQAKEDVLEYTWD